ncbi:glutathione peroxidase [Arthrobacter sp. JSM 101049]|uniref:glutathione peroxidase n=1 Tax=Arthrobacter sp. JSM 101049 TaxID=929097 RepID=UPI003561F6BE
MGNAVSTLQDIPLTLNDGTGTTFGDAFGGRVVLVVNVASRCGFTPQYAGLEELYTTYREQGLMVLGVPCNQFKEQEPGTDAEIGQFCQATYGVTFPLARKADVNGPDAHPLYRELTAYPTGEVQDVAWNFEKFLVGRDGQVLGRFRSAVEPLSNELVDAVRAAL